MLDPHRSLWARIQSFEFDEPGAAMPFTRRLAHQHRWSRRHTLRVIEEYRRFVMLAWLRGGPRLAVNTAIAALARDGAVELADVLRHRVKLGPQTPLSDDPFLM